MSASSPGAKRRLAAAGAELSAEELQALFSPEVQAMSD